MRIILASTSPYRKKLLERLGLKFETLSPTIDEADWKSQNLAPEQLALTLAVEKTRSIAYQQTDALVIGGDQLVEFQGKILGKPGDREGACRQLALLQNDTHRLLTAVCLNQNGREQVLLDETSLRMRPLSSEAIARYVDFDQPFDCAGSYKIESRGISLFEEIRCTDATTIEGLPLMALGRLLREFGVEFP